MGNWIKLSRKILEWEWFDSPYMIKFWIYLLLSANYDDRKWRGVVVERGQVVVGRQELSKRLGMSEMQVRTALSRLREGGCIDTKTTNRYTIVTICNYDKYQVGESVEQPSNNQQITSKQPTNNHNIRNKEVKNNKEYTTKVVSSTSTSVDFGQVKDFFNSCVEGSMIPKISTMSDKRKSAFNARIREFGKERTAEVIRKAAASNFLNGDNDRGFRADYDWIFKPNNFPKILEGNYDNRKPTDSSKDKRQAELFDYIQGVIDDPNISG